MAETDLPKEDAVAEAPAAPVACPRRDQSFRQGLLKKLPPLGNAAWSVKENFDLLFVSQLFFADVGLGYKPLTEIFVLRGKASF